MTALEKVQALQNELRTQEGYVDGDGGDAGGDDDDDFDDDDGDAGGGDDYYYYDDDDFDDDDGDAGGGDDYYYYDDDDGGGMPRLLGWVGHEWQRIVYTKIAHEIAMFCDALYRSTHWRKRPESSERFLKAKGGLPEIFLLDPFGVRVFSLAGHLLCSTSGICAALDQYSRFHISWSFSKSIFYCTDPNAAWVSQNCLKVLDSIDSEFSKMHHGPWRSRPPMKDPKASGCNGGRDESSSRRVAGRSEGGAGFETLIHLESSGYLGIKQTIYPLVN